MKTILRLIVFSGTALLIAVIYWLAVLIVVAIREGQNGAKCVQLVPWNADGFARVVPVNQSYAVAFIPEHGKRAL